MPLTNMENLVLLARPVLEEAVEKTCATKKGRTSIIPLKKKKQMKLNGRSPRSMTLMFGQDQMIVIEMTSSALSRCLRLFLVK